MKSENGADPQSTPAVTVYTEAMNKFTTSATAYMEQVQLLTEARGMRIRKLWRRATPYAITWTLATRSCNPL